MIHSIIEKHKIHTDKTLNLETNVPNLNLNIDVFHFENAINNIIDNAIKYGGNEIKISIKLEENNVIISVSDNGNSLRKDQKNLIFDKFYRVPKGNTHDVKGFGIGLYYSKKIIEKHNGKIELLLGDKLTIFKISIPNE